MQKKVFGGIIEKLTTEMRITGKLEALLKNDFTLIRPLNNPEYQLFITKENESDDFKIECIFPSRGGFGVVIVHAPTFEGTGNAVNQLIGKSEKEFRKIMSDQLDLNGNPCWLPAEYTNIYRIMANNDKIFTDDNVRDVHEVLKLISANDSFTYNRGDTKYNVWASTETQKISIKKGRDNNSDPLQTITFLRKGRITRVTIRNEKKEVLAEGLYDKKGRPTERLLDKLIKEFLF